MRPFDTSYIYAPSVPPPPPHGDLYFYADIPSSITADGNGVVTAWGTATTHTGSPLLITDSVTGQKAIRFGTGAKLTTAIGAADALTEGPSTVIMVCRTRHFNFSPAFGALDTSGAGAGKGYQLQLNSFLTQEASVRVNDGASWVLDNPGLTGQFVELKWSIIAARLTSTNLDTRVDGQFIAVGGTTIAITLPGATGRGLSIGGGPVDVLAIEIYFSRLSDDDIAAAEARLEGRYNLDLLQVLGGDPTLMSDVSALFPYMSKLPSGKLYMTMLRSSDESPHDTNFVEARTSLDTIGKRWGAGVNILQSNSVTRYSDAHTSEPLSDGTVFQHWFLYDGSANIQTKLQWRKSSGFNADGSPIWGSTVDLPVAGVDWVASGAQMVEDPFNAGHYHLPAFALQTGHTDETVYDIISLDSGSTWTPHISGAGDTDSRRYAENAVWFESNVEERQLTRVVGGAQAYESRSTDSGVTWNTPVTSNALFLSSAQGFKKLASGAYIAGPARTAGSFQQSSMFYLAPGSAWNGQWTSPPTTPFVDPFFGGNYYGGSHETSPGAIALVFGRSSSNNNRNNVSSRANFYEWYMTHAMPGDALPHTATVTAGLTQVIALSGAGDYTDVFDTNASGANIVISGEHATYTAGSSNGVDLFHFVDCNGNTIRSCTYTVTGGSSSWDPSLLGTQVKAWYDPSNAAKRTLNAGHIVGLTDISSAGRNLASADNSNAPALATAGINGLDACDFGNGIGAQVLLWAAHTFDALTSAEMFFVGKFATNSPGVSGLLNIGSDPSGDYAPFSDDKFYSCFASTGRTSSSACTGFDMPFVYDERGDSSNSIADFNRTEVKNVGVNAVGWAAGPQIGRNVNAAATTMLMGEFIICSPPLSGPDRTKMWDYLSAKWGTP